MIAQRRFAFSASRLALIVGIAVTLVWTVYGLLKPPGLFSDPAYGFIRWYHFLAGAPFDYIVQPDPANIARDLVAATGWWSPGQYLLPGPFTLLGASLGTAVVLTVGLCLVIEIIGWLRFLRQCKFKPEAALLFVCLLVTARYTTLNFRMYGGGEPLICAATPWILIWSMQIPAASAVRSFSLGALVVLVAFMAKLSGLIIAAAALVAGSASVLLTLRRITVGMIAGAVGAAAAFVFLQIAWFSHQTIHHYDYDGPGNFFFTAAHAAYAFAAPLTSGLAVQEFLAWVFQNPSRRILTDANSIVWIMLPFAAVFAVFTFYNRSALPDRNFSKFATIFVVLFSGIMLILYLRNAPIPLEERHYRASGMLLVAAFVAIATDNQRRLVIRFAAFAAIGFSGLYGLASMLHRPAAEKAAAIEPSIRLRLDDIDAPAIRALQDAYAKFGRDALFVVPFPLAVLTLPMNARAFSTDVDFLSEETLAKWRYAGRVKGPIYIVIQNRLTATAKRDLLLRSFVDYDPKAWDVERFAEVTIFKQN